MSLAVTQCVIKLHEEHHARTRAPLRATFVDAWLLIVRLAPPVRRRLQSRLVAFETTADRFALEAGADCPCGK